MHWTLRHRSVWTNHISCKHGLHLIMNCCAGLFCHVAVLTKLLSIRCHKLFRLFYAIMLRLQALMRTVKPFPLHVVFGRDKPLLETGAVILMDLILAPGGNLRRQWYVPSVCMLSQGEVCLIIRILLNPDFQHSRSLPVHNRVYLAASPEQWQSGLWYAPAVRRLLFPRFSILAPTHCGVVYGLA